MKISRFTNDGMDKFREVLENIRHGKDVDGPFELIDDGALTEPLSDSEEIDRTCVFTTREELAAYLQLRLQNVFDGKDMNESGVWAWLSAVYFDTVCPKDPTGRRQPGRDYRHIPSEDWRHFYRHLVRGPIRIYRLFRNNPDSAAIVLCQHPSAPGEYVEQLAARQERITNPGIIEVANRLYLDPETHRPKRGMAPNWRKPGTLRRFGQVLDQLDLTYDLYSMSQDELLGLLPKEFDTGIV